jgi:uncharacterized protein YjbI with pentapeptide repeats
MTNEIKNIGGKTLYKTAELYNLKELVEIAVKQKMDLTDANLSNVNLTGAIL